jgi:hypothetical protein
MLPLNVKRDVMKIYQAVAWAALILAGGCRPEVSTGSDPVSIRGRVTGVIAAGQGMREAHVAGFVRVEGAREPDTGYDKASITVTDSTTITIDEKGERRAAGFEAIHEGDSVEATFTGPVRESYPVQATAGRITIVARQSR